MSTKPFKLTIATPEGIVFDGEVTSLIVPAAEGALGVWANHAPLVATLREGRLTYRSPDGAERTGTVSGGTVEVLKNRATILTSRWGSAA